MMFRKCSFLSALFFILFASNGQAQTRLSEKNSIGWFSYTGTIRIDEKFSAHTEYQWRRDEFVKNWQQSLLRIGINYQLNPKVQFRLGYGWIETFPYGTYPLNAMGKDFTEHRMFEVVTINDQTGIVQLSHRFMLEQRWIGRYSQPELTKEDDFAFMNRFRYMVRAQVPLKGKEITDKTPYAAIYDEVFIGFGNNVGENIFDQNRIGILLGYRFNKTFRLEGGYLNQTVQLGREIDGKNVFQHNNGFIVNGILNL